MKVLSGCEQSPGAESEVVDGRKPEHTLSILGWQQEWGGLGLRRMELEDSKEVEEIGKKKLNKRQ